VVIFGRVTPFFVLATASFIEIKEQHTLQVVEINLQLIQDTEVICLQPKTRL
jgi:hypothetical protein